VHAGNVTGAEKTDLEFGHKKTIHRLRKLHRQGIGSSVSIQGHSMVLTSGPYNLWIN